MEFIVPEQLDVTVRNGSRAQRVRPVPITLTKTEEEQLEVAAKTPRPFGARFEYAFRSGDNEVTVSYEQPLGASEVGHGYWRKGVMLKTWRYELWPLRGWSRGPGFDIALSVTVPRAPPSWWQRTFGTVESVSCQTTSREAPRAPVTVRQDGDTLRYETNILGGREIPDRLECTWGDESGLEKPW